MANIYPYLQQVLERHSIEDVARCLELKVSTCKRWLEKENVPSLYRFQLMKLAGDDINYEDYDAKDKDQFYTDSKTALQCYYKSISVLHDLDVNLMKYTWVEPSVGSGSFFQYLPPDSIGLDIEPRCEGVMTQDFLDWTPEPGNYIVIGNPPYGFRSNLAMKFVDHSFSFADFVCFIVPQGFASWGKGSPRIRMERYGYGLVHSEVVAPNFHFPDGSETEVQVVFQVWSRLHKSKDEKPTLPEGVRVVSMSDGGSPATTRNKELIGKCDFYLPSTCFGKDVMRPYLDFEQLPGRKGYGVIVEHPDKYKDIDWSSCAFVSTNGAYNLRLDIITESLDKASKSLLL